jgi:hypothetical protein
LVNAFGKIPTQVKPCEKSKITPSGSYFLRNSARRLKFASSYEALRYWQKTRTGTAGSPVIILIFFDAGGNQFTIRANPLDGVNTSPLNLNLVLREPASILRGLAAFTGDTCGTTSDARGNQETTR